MLRQRERRPSAFVKKRPPPWLATAFLVEATGFEPTTSWSRTKRATKLRYASTALYYNKGGGVLQAILRVFQKRAHFFKRRKRTPRRLPRGRPQRRRTAPPATGGAVRRVFPFGETTRGAFPKRGAFAAALQQALVYGAFWNGFEPLAQIVVCGDIVGHGAVVKLLVGGKIEVAGSRKPEQDDLLFAFASAL